jgi:hypothetical protein
MKNLGFIVNKGYSPAKVQGFFFALNLIGILLAKLIIHTSFDIIGTLLAKLIIHTSFDII